MGESFVLLKQFYDVLLAYELEISAGQAENLTSTAGRHAEVTSTGSGLWLTLKLWLCHLLAMVTQANHLSSPHLCFLICKMGIISVSCQG